MPSLLPAALRFNAGFSLLSGLLLAVAPGTVGGWLGVDIDGWLRLAGVVLIGHGVAIIAGLSWLDIRTAARLNLAAIAPYPILMILLVVTGLVDRQLGQALVLIDGAIIAAVAITHVRGLQKQPLAHQPQHA